MQNTELTESLGDYMARVVRETVTVGTRTGSESHAAVHNDHTTFCGASTARMMELAEGWDSVTCAKCNKRVEKNISAAMKYGGDLPRGGAATGCPFCAPDELCAIHVAATREP